MKKINLRDYYPYYTQDMIVEVPDEVADILREYKLAEAAYFLRTYRHKAYFSLDYDINVEHEANCRLTALAGLLHKLPLSVCCGSRRKQRYQQSRLLPEQPQ